MAKAKAKIEDKTTTDVIKDDVVSQVTEATEATEVIPVDKDETPGDTEGNDNDQNNHQDDDHNDQDNQDDDQDDDADDQDDDDDQDEAGDDEFLEPDAEMQPYLDAYQTTDLFYRTSDKQVFLSDNLAGLHQKSLTGDKNFQSFKRK